ncbi:hypothetical protein SAMN05216326_11859 [Nitrosomonas marina]|uniref:Helix-turn-helix domain-containing protein n=1 Tax=Nitrosomonas marina TaxID=917 RepID=A0A1I0D6J5_9PROT|nr:hypothetical protein [Nitrosomonas marina]SET27835.1 hypothetical protein SAMN05216326_11859 [Nitrosomonas marina]
MNSELESTTKVSGKVSKVSQKNFSKAWNTIKPGSKGSVPDKSAGRPTLFRKEYIEQAYRLCLLGAIDKDLAVFFNVTEQTINNWKKNYPEFFESIKKAKLIMDANVAASLYKRAIGYTTRIKRVKNHDGQVTVFEIDKHYPPNVRACIFWLRNRQSKLWGG